MAHKSNPTKRLKKALFSKIAIAYLGFLGAFLFYLVLPSPAIPQIGESFPSESGFTSDLIGKPIGTYFTNLDKDQLIDFYIKGYSHSPFLNLPLLTRAIEHRSEYASEIINDMHNAKNTSFLVEINQPLRESIIIKGYGEVNQKAREEKDEKELKKFTPKEGEAYFLKITPYQVKPYLWQKILSWLIYLVIIPLVIVFFWQRIKEIGKTIKETFGRLSRKN
jgi:hypothetical protein